MDAPKPSLDQHRTISNNHSRIPLKRWLLIIGIIIVAANLRTPLTSVGSLVSLIRDDLWLSNTLAGLITTVPLVAFALLSPFIPKLGRRYGIERSILISLIVLTIGIMIRSLSGVATLYVGTALLGLAITVCNVLLPSLIKREFPKHMGSMTGIYSVSMNLCGAIASGISIPLAVGAGLSWQGALGIWGVLSMISILFWLPQLKPSAKPVTIASNQAGKQPMKIWRSGLAWQVTLFMGIQSIIFYVLVAWLPEILQSQGIGSSQSGWYLSILIMASLPCAFIVPIVAGRMRNQYLLVIMTSVSLVIGSLGLVYSSIYWLAIWVIILGLGGGSAFGLSMMFFGLRTRNALQAAELSAMAQSIGYLLAALGPAFIGFLHDVTHGWGLPLMLLVVASALLGVIGLGAARNRFVDSGDCNNQAIVEYKRSK
ncbi:CynX/NimT family MFS transporter [Paenibacillus sp. SYP-B4298]|uniref:CynX/NimT family MFS transporter n=1 Tax=Paenibacillus sp. SYP-B4298 TaxID=2996034 RepID=UPI0022DE5EEA|nr:MFS transporter [Paenibacillus sp. SYP-B4298]